MMKMNSVLKMNLFAVNRYVHFRHDSYEHWPPLTFISGITSLVYDLPVCFAWCWDSEAGAICTQEGQCKIVDYSL